MADLRRVWSGNTTIAGGSKFVDVTLSPVLLAQNKTFMVFSATTDKAADTPQHAQIAGLILNTSTLRFYREVGIGGSAVDITYYVAEFFSGVSVIHGAGVLSATVTNVNLSLAVDPAYSFPLVSHSNSNATWGAEQYIRAEIIATVPFVTTTLRLTLDAVPTLSGFNYQIVTLAPGTGSVIQATTTIAATATGTSPTRLSHGTANVATDFPIVTYNMAAAADIGYNLIDATLAGSPAGITIGRGPGGASAPLATITYYIVKWADGTAVTTDTTAALNNNATAAVTYGTALPSTSQAIVLNSGLYGRHGTTTSTAGTVPSDAAVRFASLTTAGYTLTRTSTLAPGDQTATHHGFTLYLNKALTSASAGASALVSGTFARTAAGTALVSGTFARTAAGTALSAYRREDTASASALARATRAATASASALVSGHVRFAAATALAKGTFLRPVNASVLTRGTFIRTAAASVRAIDRPRVGVTRAPYSGDATRRAMNTTVNAAYNREVVNPDGSVTGYPGWTFLFPGALASRQELGPDGDLNMFVSTTTAPSEGAPITWTTPASGVGSFVRRTGDTMTGQLTIANGTGLSLAVSGDVTIADDLSVGQDLAVGNTITAGGVIMSSSPIVANPARVSATAIGGIAEHHLYNGSFVAEWSMRQYSTEHGLYFVKVVGAVNTSVMRLETNGDGILLGSAAIWTAGNAYMGQHPVHGASYATFSRAGNTTAGNYALLANATDSFVNASGGGHLRIGNADIATWDASSFTIATGVKVVGGGGLGNYGALTIQGDKNIWGGIGFRNSAAQLIGTLMIVNTGSQNQWGMYNSGDNAWVTQWVSGVYQGLVASSIVSNSTVTASGVVQGNKVVASGSTELIAGAQAGSSPTNYFRVYNPSPNSHLDTFGGGGTYINWFAGTGTHIGNAAGGYGLLYADTIVAQASITNTPGIRFGSNSSGEFIQSNRNVGFHLDFYAGNVLSMRVFNGGGVAVNDLVGIANKKLVVADDMVSYRSLSTNTGVLYLNQAVSRYLFWDGTNYILAGASLVVNGTTYPSSREIKRGIRDLPAPERSKIRALRPKLYNYTEEPQDTPPRIGFIMEDIRAALGPEAVSRPTIGANGEEIPSGYDPVTLIAALWQRVEDLENTVEALATKAKIALPSGW